MAKVNPHFAKLEKNYVFTEVAARTASHIRKHPDANVIKMGIGDYTKPLAPVIVEAMHDAVQEYTGEATFHGYGPEIGYEFLRQAIVDDEYGKFGIGADEVFISDGINSDICNISEIFDNDNIVGITNPVYPAYLDTNIMLGREVHILPCTAENGFKEKIPAEHLDIIYLCYPNNPTGVALTREELGRWIEYALKNDSVILYDGAYESFIRDENVPHSIYEIEGAKRCAIEFRSFSKTAGFTGVRCAYTIVPKELGDLHFLWYRRQCCKYNGNSYITQRGAQAAFTEEGKKYIRKITDYYLENARIIRETMDSIGIQYTGGVNSPYIWCTAPLDANGNQMNSWGFFDLCLEKADVVVTPGCGFGKYGDGYFRLSAFGDRGKTIEAMDRLYKLLCKK